MGGQCHRSESVSHGRFAGKSADNQSFSLSSTDCSVDVSSPGCPSGRPAGDHVFGRPSDQTRIALLEARLADREAELAALRAEVETLESAIDARDARLTTVIDQYETVLRERHEREADASRPRSATDRLRAAVAGAVSRCLPVERA